MNLTETTTAKLIDDEQAELHLAMAKELLERGFIPSCKLWLGWLECLYPGTVSADEGHRLLEAIGRGAESPT
jgi:hypothetical protein